MDSTWMYYAYGQSTSYTVNNGCTGALTGSRADRASAALRTPVPPGLTTSSDNGQS